MSVWRLVTREILFRKLNFSLGCLSVLFAVGCLVAEVTLLHKHDLRTEQIVSLKQQETEAEMARMKDDYRKIMKGLGFNVLILPKDQSLSDFYAEGYASKFMPEEYVHKLAASDIVTVRHLLPMLEQKVDWPEQNRKILLIGTRGEVPLLQRGPMEPILEAVPSGGIVLGFELHRGPGLSEGDPVTLRGRKFTVAKCHPERGSKDDITAWIGLATAQEMLGKKEQINAILALECSCAWADIAKVRAEITRVLEDKVQVKEQAGKALARAEARCRAADAAKTAVEAEKAGRLELRREREAFAAVLVPLVTIGSIVWVGLLAFGNVRDRRREIGILRALGVRSGHVLAVFLLKALLIGLAGAAIGYPAGFAIGDLFGEPGDSTATVSALFDPFLLAGVMLAAPLLAMLASVVPAIAAAGQDPAVVLSEE